MQTVPETAFFQQSITSKEELEGLFVTADMEMGEAFLSHRVQSEKEENLFISRKIKEGYRAVSVAVNYVESVSTLVEPEDIVDVIFSEMNEIAEKDDKNKRETVVSRVLLENIRVVAVGRRMNELTSPENHVEYSTVTFELKPEDAVKLINATERGEIHLMLKSRINVTFRKYE
ncbi:MAG: Flp pilus assembly protein CpaB [Bacillus sp. (in: Bacteria)]|nr:Flp pilus assembly protein CpaB [Bacillus sp. (in: firmicutes)]